MSVWGKIKHGVHHAEHKAGDAGKKAADEAKHEAEKAAGEAKKKAEELEKQVEKAMSDAMGKIDDAFNSAKRQLESVEHGLEGDLKKVRDEAERDVHVARDAAKKSISDAEHAAKKELDDILAKAKTDLKKEADAFVAGMKEAAADLEEDLSSDTIKQSLEKADKVVKWLGKKMDALEDSNPELVDTLEGISDVIELGPISLNYACFYSRIKDISDVLDDVLSDDIKVSRTFLIELMTALGPTSVTVNADLEIFATFGDKIPEMPMAIFTEIADQILEEIGVPK